VRRAQNPRSLRRVVRRRRNQKNHKNCVANPALVAGQISHGDLRCSELPPWSVDETGQLLYRSQPTARSHLDDAR
jgi:hypothetical protein